MYSAYLYNAYTDTLTVFAQDSEGQIAAHEIDAEEFDTEN